MKTQNFKKYAFALALGLGFVVAPALSSLSTVQAQDWRHRQDRRDDCPQQHRNDGNYGQLDRNGNIDRNRNGIDDRYENGRNNDIDHNWHIDRNHNGVYDRYENNGRYRDYGYGNGNFGRFGNNVEVQRGYRDGLTRGQEDARDRNSFNPNNSSHYRKGTPAYREGFVRGYNEGYRQFDNRGQFGRRW